MARDTAPRAALGGAVDKRAAGVGARWRGDPHRPCPGVLARAARFWPLLYNDWHPLCAATWLAYLLEKSRGLRSGTKIHLLSRWRPRRRPPVALSSAPAVHASHQPWLHRRGHLSLTPRAQPGTTLRVEATLEWLVCQDICIPEFGTLTLQRPIHRDGPRWDARELAMLAQARRRVPGAAEAAPWQIASAHLRTGAVQITLVPTTSTPDIPTLFPVQGDLVSPGAPPTERTSHGVTMTFPLLSGRPPPARLRFVMVVGDRAWELEDVLVLPGAQALYEVLPAHLSLVGTGCRACWWTGTESDAVCLPGVGDQAAGACPGRTDADTTSARSLGYTLGVLTTFGALGAVFLALRATGAAFGWGFQLQSPVIVLGLVVVFWLMALNLLGVFEWGIGLMALAGRQRTLGHASRSSAFLTGMLAVLSQHRAQGPLWGRLSERLPRYQRLRPWPFFLDWAAAWPYRFSLSLAFHRHGVGAQSRAMDGDAQAWVCLPSVRNRRVAPLGAGSTDGL